MKAKNCAFNKPIEKLSQLLGRLLLGVLLVNFSLFYSSAIAAIYYVDYASGSDTNAGTTSSPWRRCPGMSEWSGTVTLKSGDILYFKNTSTWTPQPTPAQGTDRFLMTVTDGITYDGSTWGTSGSRATFAAQGNYDNEAKSVVGINHSNIKFKGFNVTGGTYPGGGDAGTPGGWDVSGIDICIGGSCFKSISDIEVSNCLVHNTGHTVSNSNYHYGIAIGSVNAKTTSNVQILNNKVYNVLHEGIAPYPTNWNSQSDNGIFNVTIRGNEVYNTGRCGINGAFGQGIGLKNWMQNIVIEWNYLHDNPECGVATAWANPNVTGHPNTGIIMRYNIISNNGAYGIYLMPHEYEYVSQYGGNGPPHWEITIYGNLIINNGNYPLNKIYNNNQPARCGVNPGCYYAAAQINFMGRDYGDSIYNIYNNTIISTGQTTMDHYAIFVSSHSRGTPQITFKNNIIYSDDHMAMDDRLNLLNLNGGSHSNNLFYRTSGSADGVIGIGEYGSSVPLKTFDRSSVTSYEASAQGSDPMFKNVVNLPAGFTGIFGTNMEPTTDGLLISTGDAIGQGATLDTSYNGAINLSGRSGGLTRPSTGGWDIGAYQYQSSNSEKPHAPNNFRAVQQSR